MPEKSRSRYDKELRDFNTWRSKKYDDSKALNETIVFAYITNLAKNYKASSLWTKFSMLKKAFIVDSDIDISRFGKVMAFMKKQTITFSPRKAKILSVSDCRRFILEASDDYLFCKVVLIFGLYGACRRDELLKLTVDDIEDYEKYVLVKVQDASRTFIIPDASECLNPYQIYQKYAKLRPRNCGIKRFFLGYRHGKCVAQPAGMHTIGGVPRKVAIFLGLPNPENYTGHSLRRSGVASLAAEVCGNYLPTKPIAEEKSTKVVEQPVSCKMEVVSNEQSNEITPDVVAAASSSIEEEDLEITGNINYDEPLEIETSTILPEKSKGIYEVTFGRYESWCVQKKVKNPTSEKVLLAYFEELAKDKKPTSLWSYYSMLRSVLAMKKQADISKYKHLLLFLKRNAEGYKGKKSRIFTRDNITRFLQEAKNGKFLMIKVAFIIGLTGACRREELKELRTENVTDQGHFFRILIPKSRANKKAREFFVTAGSVEGVNMVQLIRKYVSLRPPHTSHSRFFIVYSNKKCSIQPVGIRTFGNIPKIIATFLKLPNTDEFTGHSFRGSSAALLEKTGGYI